jgi:hypothetical protein
VRVGALVILRIRFGLVGRLSSSVRDLVLVRLPAFRARPGGAMGTLPLGAEVMG